MPIPSLSEEGKKGTTKSSRISVTIILHSDPITTEVTLAIVGIGYKWNKK
jgi:hypothetical protein